MDTEHPAWRQWLVGALVTSGVFLAMVDTTIVDVVLPKMMPTLETDTYGIQWVVISYFMGGAVAMTFVGWLADRIGHRNAYLAGLLIFVAMSAACGEARTLSAMVTARFVQGIGEGFLITTGLLLLYEAFPPEQHGLALGLYGVGGAFGPAIGPSLGGLLTEHFHWPSVFFINVPLGLLTALVLWLTVKNERSSSGGRLDVVGAALLSTALVSFVTLTAKGQEKEWLNSDFILALVLVCGAATIGFLLWELLAPNPLIPRTLFDGRHEFPLGLIAGTGSAVTSFGMLLVVPLYLERLRGYTALEAGLIMLPGSIAAALMLLVAGALSDRLRPKWIAITILFLAFCTNWVFRTPLDGPRAAAVWDFFVVSLFGGTSMAPILLLSMAPLREHERSCGTMLVNITRLVAASTGTAFAVSTLSSKQAAFYVGLASRIDAGSTGARTLLGALGSAAPDATGWFDTPTMYRVMAAGRTLLEAHAASYAFDSVTKHLAVPSLAALVVLLFARNLKGQGGAIH